eukprot:TRINITY_DN11140_c0_g1_i1.p1 TRINITY_DN11140_c0_g1~~TRINITY_DN11140_c0_g1_i1.p1  ORF type:complete len:282 (+),score=87.60 TRINITY_DN11140_c0_g1_i1:98-847(+)
MARNEEKSHSMLNRWVQQQKDDARGGPVTRAKRPYLADLVDNLPEATKWRTQLIKEVAKKVLLLQNESLPEMQVRDLNDQVNKLMRERWHWHRRIKELGGPEYPNGPPVDSGNVIRAPGGYWYFGVAKNLPGVKDLLVPEVAKKKKRNRHELHIGVDGDYYGFRDDEDGLLEKVEAIAEERLREGAIAEWNKKAIERYGSLALAPVPEKIAKGDPAAYKSHVYVPSTEEVERILLQKRKEDLVARYVEG